MECNLSDEEVEEDYTDSEKHLDMEKSDCEPKALPQGSLKVAIKGDLSREEASMDNTEMLGELQREENKHVEVIKGEDGEGMMKERCKICGKKVANLEKHILSNHKEEIQCQFCVQNKNLRKS